MGVTRPEAGVPVRRGARTEIAEHLAPARHALTELVRERPDHALGDPQRAQAGARHGNVAMRRRLRAAPLLVARHRLCNRAQPRPPAPGVRHMSEDICGARIAAPVRPQHVALDVRTIDGHQNASPNARCSSSGPHPLRPDRERDQLLARGQRCLHLRDRRMRVGGDEEPGVDLVVQQVRLELGTRRLGRAADAAPPDLPRLGRELHAQLVEVGIERSVEVAREDQIAALEVVLSPLRRIVHPVVQDHPAGEVGTGEPRQRAADPRETVEVVAQLRLRRPPGSA